MIPTPCPDLAQTYTIGPSGCWDLGRGSPWVGRETAVRGRKSGQGENRRCCARAGYPIDGLLGMNSGVGFIFSPVCRVLIDIHGPAMQDAVNRTRYVLAFIFR